MERILSRGIWLSSSGGDELKRLLEDLLGCFDNGTRSDAKMIDEFAGLAVAGDYPNRQLVHRHSVCAQRPEDGIAEFAVDLVIFDVSEMGRNAPASEANKTNFGSQ